jgi:Domain of unknown function (DUF4268)
MTIELEVDPERRRKSIRVGEQPTREVMRFVHPDGARVDVLKVSELYIDTGDGDRNDEIFQYLRDRHEQVEGAYGHALEWEELPTKRACRVAQYKDDGPVADSERWEEYIAWFLDSGTRLRAALGAVALPL